MSEVEVPFVADNAYGKLTFEHPSLSEEQALVVDRSQVDFEKIGLDVKRRADQ